MEKTQTSALSTATCIVYSVPYAAMVWLHPQLSILQGVYAKYYGLSLTAIATIILLTLIIDVISDPLAGYFSDR